MINGEANHRPLSIGCGKASWTKERGRREATATASLYYTRRKKWEREREKALLMIIFLTPRKITAIAPAPAADEGPRLTAGQRLGGEGGGALIDFKSPILWRRLHKFSRRREENFSGNCPPSTSSFLPPHLFHSRVACLCATHLSVLCCAA